MKFGELQTMLGINYNECGVLLSPYRDMLNMPISRFTDWFHDLIASGGLFVYIVNEVVLGLLAVTHLTLEAIDKFAKGLTLPDHKKLSPTFFQERIVLRRGCHVKAFASEAISSIFVLCFVFECVVKGDVRFDRQARMCALMRESLEILLAGDKAVRLADRLDAVLEALQTLVLASYP